MNWAFFGTLVKQGGKGRYRIPYVFVAPPGITDEAMLEQALWLKKKGFRAVLLQGFVPSPITTSAYHPDKNLLPKSIPGSDGVYIPKGMRQRYLHKRRRLHKAFLCFDDPDNWPMLRGALRRMGRADLIGSGRHQLVPACPPRQANSWIEDARQAV